MDNKKDTCSIDAEYTNPDNLNYYLIKDSELDFNVKVIKKKNITTAIGNIELAIIGSSHYVRVQNFFTELLTCTKESIGKDMLITKYNSENINFTHDFGRFIYKISVFVEIKKDLKDFNATEQSIFNQQNDLHYFFGDNTSLTSIKSSQKKDKYKIETWHTYPECLKIVYSVTELI